MEQFGGNEERCREYLAALRWPESVRCPRCPEQTTISYIFERAVYDCDSCRYQFSVTAGTIFNDTHLPLWKWFLAVYLMCEGKKGISANQLGRSIKVAYKTAWYLCHRIRRAMTEVNAEPVGGKGTTVEMDETYVGGKRRHVGSGYVGNKTMVLGTLERGGPVRFKVERRTKRGDKRSLHGFVGEATKPDTSDIYTGDNPGYVGIADADTKHESVSHSSEEWVRGDVHTNGVESVWSLLKRSIIGAFHHVSMKHLDAYLDELEHRFNNRSNEYIFRDTLTKLVQAEKLPYSELTKAA